MARKVSAGSNADDAREPKRGEWRIAEQRTRCESCGTPFLVGQEFYSRLEEAGEFAFVRRDCCGPCFARAGASGSPWFWKTRRLAGPDARQLVDLDSLHALFLSLVGEERPEVAALRYVIALMLLRKRKLKAIRHAHAARGDLVFKDPRDEEGKTTLRLETPDLSAETLADLREQLKKILS